MVRLLDRMPFPEESEEIAFRGERVRLRANQIIIWITLGLQRATLPHSAAIPFPAILDTGHTDSFSIQQRHLIEWAGLRPESLAIHSAVRDRGLKLFRRVANIWIHANERGQRHLLAKGSPHPLEALAGIAIYPDGDFPRLPILGLRAIAENDLVLKVSGWRREATLRTSFKWSIPFG